MKALLKIILICSVAAFFTFVSPSIHAEEEICDLGSPWLTDEVASLMLTNTSIKDHLRSNVHKNSSSVELQLLLWAFAKGKISVEYLAGRVNVESIVEQSDDALMSLLWIIAEANIDPNDNLGIERFFDDLDRWANTTIKQRPRRMFLTVIAASGISGKQQLTLAELDAMSFQIRDPELLQNIAGKHIQGGRHEMAHSLLVEALESGLFSALLGLGDLEANYFPACAERGAVYRRLFAAVWLRK